MRFFVVSTMFFLLFMNKIIAVEPEYIIQGREILSQWGEIYCIKKYSVQEINVSDVNDSLDLFNHSDRVYSLVYSVNARDAIFKYVDNNVGDYGNLSVGNRLELLACVEISGSEKYKSFIKKQDRYLYQTNAGIGAVIRADGQKVPLSGIWRMITRYGEFETHKFKKGDIFPAWKNSDGATGYEWVLEKRDDGGAVKLDNPYF
ncbi:hypothetical protein LVQ78_13700 [Buttiauxella sp. A2-C2_NF]|uniref:hypothetical protein n=1 Tax=Buttiauxella ferragutiae TaxID=82989 RepID=UPI001E2D0876|nr:hypothetical protein [Buttiauxella ferragutiae]MCE0827084.1 hypothetical protein [Buttiauxella ferragutiae]